jgi:predicted enzyme related to lactoylglutathione lyase
MSVRKEENMEYRLDHIHVTTGHIDEWVDFYVEVLGGHVTGTMNPTGNRMVNLDIGGMPLRVSSQTGVETYLATRQGHAVAAPEGHHHYGFMVDDVEAAIAEAVDNGARLEVPVFQASPTLRCCFIQGPGGVRMEVCQQVSE